MSALLVTFAIDDPDHEAALNARLDRFDNLRLSATSRVVETDLPPHDLFQQLEEELGGEDRVYVFTLDRGWIGYGYTAINDWLHRHVGPGPDRCP